LNSIDERNNTLSEEDGILVEEQEVVGFKCGICGANLRVKVFFKDGEYHRRISCPKCKYKITPSKRMPL
jgi:DNA-directed RNA polymerase subunit RPC12/RpoP